MTEKEFIDLCDELSERGNRTAGIEGYERFKYTAIQSMKESGIDVIHRYGPNDFTKVGIYCMLHPLNKKAEKYLAMYKTYKLLKGEYSQEINKRFLTGK